MLITDITDQNVDGKCVGVTNIQKVTYLKYGISDLSLECKQFHITLIHQCPPQNQNEIGLSPLIEYKQRYIVWPTSSCVASPHYSH